MLGFHNYQDKINLLWPQQKTKSLTTTEEQVYKERIKALLIQKQAAIVAHYYVDEQIQALADETGGIVADAAGMASFGVSSKAETLVVAGVHFMGETAKILNPNKKVLMPTLAATCSLVLSCEPEEFAVFKAKYPDRTAVVYANSSAAVKAQADWVVTSSNALAIIEHLHEQGQKILWAPDRNLGTYIQKKTNADMMIWQGACIVHDEFRVNAIKSLKEKYPTAGVLVHPEAPFDVIALADSVGATTHLIKAAQTLPHQMFIVATENAIFYKMRQAAPTKLFIQAPTGGNSAMCRSCGHCPWMAMNQLNNLADCLEKDSNEILLNEGVRAKAYIPIKRMLDFMAVNSY